MSSFPHIFSPLTIKQMTVKNRICSTGHFAGWWSFQGLPNDDCVAYFEERAKGGIGLVTIGATAVREGDHPAYFHNLDHRIVECYRKVADAVHRHGTMVLAQFCPRGLNVKYWEFGEPKPADLPVAASRPGRPVGVEGYQREVSPSTHVSSWSAAALRDLVECTARAAARAREGGVDGVELHAHQHHLHAQFLSPVANRRTDEYGGSFENRTRLLVETFTAMRRAVGDDFAVGLRCKSHDFHPDGMVEQDYIRLIQMLETKGLIDFVSLTAGARHMHTGSMYQPDGENLTSTAEVRRQVKSPVIHAGRIRTPQMAEEALASGMVDLVGMTKTHFADPHFVNKVRQGRLDDIRYCIRCGYCCDGGEGTVSCIYNPVTSRERDWTELRAAPASRRVVIVGGGPAGMEAAVTAAARGHDVVVLEKSTHVGGQVRLAGAAPLRNKFMEIAEFYERQAHKGSFELRLGVEATADDVLALAPDVVIIATGSRPVRPSVPGLNGGRLWTVHDVLSGLADSAKNVLIVDRDGHAGGFVAADWLSHRGAKVQFEAAMERVAMRMGDGDAGLLCEALGRQGVSFRAGFDVVRSDEKCVIMKDIFTGDESTAGPFDAVVLNAGAVPVNALASELAGRIKEIHVIGAAKATNRISEATVDGARVGRWV